ncbi:MAG: tetratricopeptide repeat protein [Nannocystaceae bacterium]|nr:tetratricopeptide repeat protein [Nannocystaceae bacterium]
MDDPFFEETISAVRGFDLGDDDELLAALERPDQALSPDERLLRGVLHLRAGRSEPAMADLDQVASTGHPTAMSQVHYLRSRLLAQHGRTAAAGEALDAAERAAQTDGGIPEAELAHARAWAEWQAGRPDDALAHVARGLTLDASSGDRWRDKGSLYIELSRPTDAITSLKRALTLQTDDAAAMALQAIAYAATDDVNESARWLERALHLAPERRAALASEPRLTGVRYHPSVARLLEPPAPAEVAWMDEKASWISALRYAMTRTDTSKRHPIEWLDRTESRRLHSRMTAEHERGPLGTMHSAATLDHAREVLSDRVIVARGPSSATREGAEERCLIAMDPRPHGELWVALSDIYPAFLWIAAGRDAASVTRVLDEYFPRPTLPRLEMHREVRGFIGYRERIVVPDPHSGRLQPAGEVEIDRHFTLNPFVESAGWSSAFTDDPWPDQIPSQPGVMLKIDRRRRKLAEQAPGAVWSMTRRLRHSRGYLSVQRHHGDVFVAVVRYRPTSHPSTVQAVNKQFGTDYPEDLPVDAIGALLGFQFDSADDLQASLQATTDPYDIAGRLMVLSALRHSDLDAQAVYRTWAKHPDAIVRATVCSIAVAYNYESLLEIMSVDENDSELRAQIEAVLDEGIAPPELEASESISAEVVSP